MKTRTIVWMLSVAIVAGVGFGATHIAYAAQNPFSPFPLLSSSTEATTPILIFAAKHSTSAGSTTTGSGIAPESSITSHIQSGTRPIGKPCGGPGQLACQNVPTGPGYHCATHANHISCVPLKPY